MIRYTADKRIIDAVDKPSKLVKILSIFLNFYNFSS